MRMFRPFLRTVLLASVFSLLSLTGCEDPFGGGGGDSHDFGDNDSNVYVAFGDSITQGYGASTAWPGLLQAKLGKTVVNQGIGGSRASEGAARVNGVLRRYKPGYLLILYGANDIIHGASTASIVANLRSIVQAAKNNKTVPVIATVLPMTRGHAAYDGGVDAVNPEIRKMANEEGATIVDLHSAFSGKEDTYLTADGLHPNNAGQQLIADSFAGAL